MAKGGYLFSELRQRGGVAFGEFADASGESLRNAVELSLHARRTMVVSHLSSTTSVLISSSLSLGYLAASLASRSSCAVLSRALASTCLLEQRQRTRREPARSSAI
jgi:hypothetical protein